MSQMTIKEYIAKKISTELNPINPTIIEFLGFDASPSHVWSEYTAEDFSCRLLFDRKDVPAKEHNRDYWSLSLDEEDVCDFLNELFPAPWRENG